MYETEVIIDRLSTIKIAIQLAKHIDFNIQQHPQIIHAKNLIDECITDIESNPDWGTGSIINE
jgi:hypothetical protein